MSKKSNNNLKRPELQPSPSDYDLFRALNAIRKGVNIPYDSAGGTKTDIKIGSVNLNVWSNSQACSETDTQLGDKYVTEKYVESIVNNLKADQTNSSTRLIELFNGKIGQQNEKIDAVREKSLSKSSFWIGIGLAVSVVCGFASLIYDNVKDYNKGLVKVSNTVKDYNQRIEKLEESVDSLQNAVIGINDKLEPQKQQKKK